MKTLFASAFSRNQSRQTLSKLPVLVVAIALSFSAGVSADDTEIFFSSESAPPNILFVLDDSASMSNATAGESRMARLQEAMTNLVASLEGVNAGIVQFNGAVDFTAAIDSVDDDAHRQHLQDTIDAMVPRIDFFGTATQDALWTARSYFRGELASPTGVYPTPVTHECQQNHIILMTDGRPTAWSNIVPEVESGLGITCAAALVNDAGDGDCGIEIGQHLFDTPVVDGYPDSNVTTHTIGFDFDHPWLATISGNTVVASGLGGVNSYSGGFGNHFTVSSADGLLDAFEFILDGIGTSFAAPTVSVNSFNESRHSDELYYAQFQSSSSVRWNGNIKKYRLNEHTDIVTGVTRTLIVDANGQPLTDATGKIVSTSQSLWSDEPDGASIPQGGFAHQLPSYTDRNWYTDYDSADPIKVTFENPAALPVESLGAADTTERDTLVEWALGRDPEEVDALIAAAATDDESAATAAAAAAAVAAAEAAVAAAAAATAAADAQALADTLSLAATVAAEAVDTAIADSAANLADLIMISDAAGTEADEAIATAAALSDTAVAAADADASAQSVAYILAQAASLAIAAAVDASDETNFYVGDSIHNTPIIASYWAKSDPEESGEILFSANNLGFLHAIDPQEGVELWSYTPEEHLGNIKKYYENAESVDHVYGLDGEFTLHTTRSERADYDYWVDKARLYMTERRGGNRVYALDVTNGLGDRSTDDPFSVMWKITGGDIGTPVYDKNSDGTNDFVNLAQTWSKPQVVNVRYNCPDDCESKEVLMFSGGYNADIYDDVILDYDAMTVPTESHGNAVYFVDPETGELVWSVGNGAHHSLNLPEMNHSIPSTPVPVDTDLDGSVDLLFFVDIGGDVWRIDFGTEGADTDELHLAGGKIAELSPAGQSLRFFNPIDVVVSGTNFSTAFFSLVTGSGMRSSPLYPEPNQNRLYSIVDRWVRGAPVRVNASGDKEYDYRYVTDSAGDHSVITAGDDTLKHINDASSTTSTEYGYFRTFSLGEKILQRTLVHSNQIFVNSYVPPVLTGGVNCNYDIGETRLYGIRLLDGENAFSSLYSDGYLLVGDGLLGPFQIVDTGIGDAPLGLPGGPAVFAVEDLLPPDSAEVFRRFRRTGWVELNEY